MKTIKIAVIAMIGMSLGISAQHNYDNQNIIYSKENKVGIGVKSPYSSLDVRGNISATGSEKNNDSYVSQLNFINYYTTTSPMASIGVKTRKSVVAAFDYTNIVFETSNGFNTLSEKMRIADNGNVGIGTSNPRQKLELYNSNAFNNNMEFQSQDHLLLSSSYKNNDEFFGGITWESGGRRRASIVATREHSDADHVGMAFFTKGTDGPGAFFESMRISYIGNIGIGTTSPKERLDVNGSIIIKDGHNLSWGNKYGTGIPTIAANTTSGLHFYPNGSTLGATMRIFKDGKTRFTNNMAVLGKIESKEIKVTNTPTADFVFEEDYDLPTLKSIEKHIKEKKHLPEIASAKEMEKNGVNIGDFQIQLLQKIEELTLYTIEQEKRLNSIESKNEKLEKENETLKLLAERLTKIEEQLKKKN
ncbi:MULTISPECIES: coiled-coil domain-containing protein 30 [Tenacibaculum]|uniref:coiled-coil domain-containing protein 30 n=1 Tax=Tenacibaculum TaxID=104267 RepID=UPI0008965270|nr:coiled-coil domain-containing protein 30 [Tenacibaculum sp. MAR_2010_89]SEE34882.1 hypothetical protein SAMN04487765_2228 [Tenacibaculum sp. MAR_2010_89]